MTIKNQTFVELKDRVREARIGSNLSQSELARQCEVSPSAISHIEAGNTCTLSGSFLLKLASALSVSPYWLETGSKNVESGHVIRAIPDDQNGGANTSKPMRTLAERLLECREGRNWTQLRLANEASLKQQSIIGMLESGERKKSSHLIAIAQALGVNALWLQYEVGDKYPSQSASHMPQEHQPLPIDEQSLLSLYRTLSAKNKEIAIRLLKAL